MRKLAAAFIVALSLLPALASGQEIIEKFEVVGNDKVTQETILFYISSREGSFYNEDQLRQDFMILWSTGFFANLRFESLPGTRGRIVRIVVEENPVVKTVTYKTGKKVKQNDIVEKLKEKDQDILPYSYYSPHKIEKIKKTISELLDEKGLLAAKIDTEVRKQGQNEVEVFIRVDEGPKVRVGEVVFDGTAKIPDNLIRWSMKENRPHNLFNWIAGKDVYKQNKIEENISSIKKKFQSNGYMEATVGDPRVEQIEKKNIFFKEQTMVRLVIPVDPGYLYRVGEVKIEGNKAFNVRGLSSMVKFEPGDIYSTKVREKAIEDIGELYRDFGYLYAQIIPVENLDPKRKVVNVTFNIYEGEVAYLNRLEFRGNAFTKDKVIRREMIIREGDRFSLSMFKNSILRIKQLGLVDLEKDPDIVPNPEDPKKIDVTVNVRELQRNNIQFTAGYSGYEGTFIAFSYSTVNFLGAGENLEFMVQTGKRVKNYMFGFTEPYLFDKPITAGFNIYHRELIYPWYERKGRGIDLILGSRLFEMWRANLTYTYEKVKIGIPGQDEGDGAVSPYYSPYYNPYYFSMYGQGNYNESSITPVLFRSTIDSPLTPTRGTLYSASMKYAGTFLGGDIDLIKPRLEFTRYQPVISNHSVGVHVEYSFIKALRGSDIPFWEKYFLGGERSIRGYEVYTIGPRSEEGINMGGDKSLVINAEYIVPVGGPLYAILFYDVGNAIAYDRKFSLKDMYTSLGLEARIFVPALRVPFRLIFSFNNRKELGRESNFAFRFAVGTTF
jgi:outer membrane protein insertion porin family